MGNNAGIKNDLLEPGIWRGSFYGKVAAEIGSEVRGPEPSKQIADIHYCVTPAYLISPLSQVRHRSAVWIGGVSDWATHTSVGSLKVDPGAISLFLTLKVTHFQIGYLIRLLKNGDLREFQFDVISIESRIECNVQGWSASL
jgi:hypothetical protein